MEKERENGREKWGEKERKKEREREREGGGGKRGERERNRQSVCVCERKREREGNVFQGLVSSNTFELTQSVLIAGCLVCLYNFALGRDTRKV